MIDNHFLDFVESDMMSRAYAPHSGIVVVMKYNGHHKVSFGTVDALRNGTDGIKAKLRQLLTSDDRVNDGTLSVETMILARRPRSSRYGFSSINSNKNFATGVSGGGRGSGATVNRQETAGLLKSLIPRGRDRGTVGDFLHRL
jgi:hypothetical protein